MTDKEAYKMIGDRADELAKLLEVQEKCFEIYMKDGFESVEQYVYMLAIGSLYMGLSVKCAKNMEN